MHTIACSLSLVSKLLEFLLIRRKDHGGMSLPSYLVIFNKSKSWIVFRIRTSGPPDFWILLISLALSILQIRMFRSALGSASNICLNRFCSFLSSYADQIRWINLIKLQLSLGQETLSFRGDEIVLSSSPLIESPLLGRASSLLSESRVLNCRI